MTRSSIIFLHFAFLSFFHGCLATNQQTIMVQSPEDNGERTGNMQMEGLSSNSESVTVQSQEENNESAGEMQTDDLSTDSDFVIVQNEEDNNERSGKIQKDYSINPGGIKVQIHEENKAQKTKIIKVQTENVPGRKMHPSTNPESVMVKSQVDNNQRFGRIQMGNSQQKASFIVDRVFYQPSSRLYIICNQTNACITATYEEMLYIVQNNPGSVRIQNILDNNQNLGRMQAGDIQEEASFNVHSVSFDPSSRLYTVCNQTRACIRVTHEEISGIIPNATPAPNDRRSSVISQSQPGRSTQVRNNNRETNRDSISQTQRNNNNNRRNSMRINSPSEREEKFEDNYREKAATISPPSRRTSIDASFSASLVNEFAFKLVEALNLQSNFVISPLSIFVALSMCYLGSDGKTKDQIEQSFGIKDYGVHGEVLHKGIKDLLSLVLKETSGYELFVANGMFLGNNFTAETQFEENIKNYYDAEIQKLDFRNSGSLKFINVWVAKNTRNMITSIINRPPDSLTRLILLNAVFFKGTWKMQFPPSKTYNGKFHTLDRNEKQAQFMRLLDETFPVFRSEQLKHTFIKLPYAGDQVSMIIALPFMKEQKPMPKVTDEILYYDVRENMVDTELGTIAIPKFRLEYQTTLKRPLEVLGIKDIFFASEADLSKIRKEKDLYISKITHKAVVDVDEVGTTAAAVTSDFVGLVYKNKTNFIADHPFAFYIVHEATGLVLFYGKVYDFDSVTSDSNDERENVPVRPKPTEANGSNNRRENPRFKPRPAGDSDSNNRRENPRFKPRPAGESDSDDRREPERFGPRPAEESDSYDRSENERFKPRPAGESDSSNRRENPRFKPRPVGESDSNDRRENERFGPRPVEDSDSNDRGENERFIPGLAGQIVPNERRETTVTRNRPTEASYLNNRRENPRFKPRPAEVSDSGYRRENPGSRYRPENDSNNRRQNERFRRPAETSDSYYQRNDPRDRPRPAVGSDFDFS